MTKTTLFMAICFTLFFSTVYATTSDDKPSSYEEIYPEIGYKTVEEASDDFERHFNEKLKLPLRVPPLTFTHHFGRFNDSEYEGTETFKVTLINDQIPENHYKIDVRPLKYKLPIREKYVIKTFELKNGTVATYMTFSGFNLLVFERDSWQYTLNINKRGTDKVTPEILVEIANSIDY